MEIPTVLFLIGVPYSGKSTFVRNFLSEKDPEEWAIVSSDKWLENKAHLENISYNESFLKYAALCQDLMYDEARKAIKNKINIIWDQTNLTPKARKSKINLFRDEYYKVAVYFKPLDPVELQRRISIRTEKIIPAHILERMSKDLTEPDLSEGFDKIIIQNSIGGCNAHYD